MNVRRIEEPASFLSVASPLLLADEARHNLMLGLAGTLRDHPDIYPVHRLWVVEHGGHVICAAVQTPPFNLVIAEPVIESAIPALVDAVIGADVALPGVTGATPEADAFARAWEARARVMLERRRRQRIYRLTQSGWGGKTPNGIRLGPSETGSTSSQRRNPPAP